MTDYIKVISVKSEFISVGWYIGSTCNYNCSYCLERYHDGKHKFPSDLDGITRFIKKLRDKYPDKRIFFTVYGGEPTIWTLFEDFSKLCKENNSYIRVVTNGSRSIDWWKQNKDYFYRVIVSYHYDSADKNHMMELMKLLGYKGQLNLMMPPNKKDFDDLLEIGKWISDEAEVFAIPKFLRIDMGDQLYDYDDEQLEIFKNKTIGPQYLRQEELFWYKGFVVQKEDGTARRYSNCRQIFLENINKWKGWYCWGGIDAFFIDQDENIYVGQCRRGFIGKLKDEYDLPDKPIVCPKDLCNCSQDIIDCNKEKYFNEEDHNSGK